MNVAIVGAGLTGRLLAWQLAEAGFTITLFDKDTGLAEQSAAVVAAAMLAPISEVLDAEPVVYEKGLLGFSYWSAWQKKLLETTGVDIDLRLQGSLVVAHRQDMGGYQQFVSHLAQQHFLSEGSVKNLQQDELKSYEPELAENFSQGYFLKDEGCLDNSLLLQALAIRLKQLSVVWQTQCFIDEITGEQFSSFDKVLDCRGFGGRQAIAELRGVRGEVIKVHAPEVTISRPVRLIHPRYKLYISPKTNQHYVIGATQIESASEAPITVRSSLELLSALYSVHTGFSEANIIGQWARCRPALKDNLPGIFCEANVVRINGLFRHGYLLSPAVVAQVLSLFNLDKARWPEIMR